MRIMLVSIFVFCVATASVAQQPDPQAVIDQAIEVSGGARFAGSVIEFDFRGRHFSVKHQGGAFSYTRTYADTSGRAIEDMLSNGGFYRKINGQRAELSERMQAGLPGSINSVVYFALLPYKLNDAATIKRYLGQKTIKGVSYHLVEVTFREEGGGQDWQDIFLYWIHTQHHTMDYLAYTYHVNGGGARFRAAHNIRTVEGIRFADFRNYKTAEGDSVSLEEHGRLFNEDALIKVSDVNLENVRVKLLAQ